MPTTLLKTATHSFRTLCGLAPSAVQRRRKQQCRQIDDLEPRLLMTARVWDGGGGQNHDWTNRFNWQGNVAPVANDDLIFPTDAPVRLTKNTFSNDASGTFRSISFAGIGYGVTGNPIRLTTGITSSSPTQFIDTQVQFVGNAAHNIVVGSDAELVLNRSVSGPGALVKQGFGRLTLAGSNTFTGQFNAQAGVTQLAHSNALGSTAGQTTVVFGATIELAEFIASGEEFPRTLTIPETLVLEDAGLGTVAALRNVSGDNRWTGAIKLGGGPNNTSNALPNRIAVDAPGGEFSPDQLTISGVISDAASFAGAGFRKVGTGRLILSGTNTYRGTTSIEEGVVQMKNSSALGSAVGRTEVFAGAGLELVQIQLGGNETVTLAVNEPLQLSGPGFQNSGALRNVDGSNAWLGNVTLVNSSHIGVDLVNDVLFISGLIDGAGKSLTKIAAGELLLTANNTYSGRASSVEAGVLTVNGLQPSTNIIVNGGVLQGTGTVGAVTVQSGGAISPAGNFIGTLTINGNFTNRGEYRVNDSPSGSDKLKVNGKVNLTTSTIKVSGNTTLRSLTVIENDLTDAVQGTTNGALVTSNSAQVFAVSYAGGTGNDVVLTRRNTASTFANRGLSPTIIDGNDLMIPVTNVDLDGTDVVFTKLDWFE